MKKITSILCLLALTVGLLAGCGSTSGMATTAETTAAPAAETTVETTAETTAAPTEPAGPVRLGAMTGPTGIGMVKLFRTADENPDSGYTYTIKGAADELTPMILQGELDIVSVPANLASVLYNKTEGGVQALAVNVLGVLYVAEFNGETVQSVADLKGKTLYATGKGSTPEYFLRYVLTQNGIDPASDVTIEWKSEQAECLSALMAEENTIAMLPQPFVTTAQTKSENIRVALDLTEEWDEIQAESDAPSTLVTGVVVGRTEFVAEHPEAVSAFLEHYRASVEYVNANVDEAAQLVGQYEIVAAEVAQKALPECNIVFIEGVEMKDSLSGYLSVLFEQNPKSVGGALPDDAFYYSR